MKRGIRVLGVDDSPFTKKDKRVLIVGVVQRGDIVEGVVSSKVTRDGLDATRVIERLASGSRFLPQIRLVITNGIMMAGFNVIDINDLSEKLSVPVIAVTRRKPNSSDVKKALSKLKETAKRLKTIEKAGESVPIEIKGRKLWAQLAGISKRDAESALETFGLGPLRLAHIIASGIVKGESSGKF